MCHENEQILKSALLPVHHQYHHFPLDTNDTRATALSPTIALQQPIKIEPIDISENLEPTEEHVQEVVEADAGEDQPQAQLRPPQRKKRKLENIESQKEVQSPSKSSTTMKKKTLSCVCGRRFFIRKFIRHARRRLQAHQETCPKMRRLAKKRPPTTATVEAEVTTITEERCPYCRQVATLPLNQHMKVCPRNPENKMKMISRHLKSKMLRKQPVINIKPMVKTPEHLEEEKDSKEGLTTLTCHVCSKAYVRQKTLDTHMKKFHNQNLKRRVRASPGIEPIRKKYCGICCRWFKNLDMHNETVQTRCPVNGCTEVTHGRELLGKHIRECHPESEFNVENIKKEEDTAEGPPEEEENEDTADAAHQEVDKEDTVTRQNNATNATTSQEGISPWASVTNGEIQEMDGGGGDNDETVDETGGVKEEIHADSTQETDEVDMETANDDTSKVANCDLDNFLTTLTNDMDVAIDHFEKNEETQL